MQNNHNDENFSYTYSAKEQEELKKIRAKYQTQGSSEEEPLTKLRRLDRRVTQKAQVFSLVFGIVGALILGFGMSLIMSDFSAILGTLRYLSMPIGIAIGVFGGALAAFAYPLYSIITAHERKKIAPEIIRLTDALMK